jgi:hypothetical protein
MEDFRDCMREKVYGMAELAADIRLAAKKQQVPSLRSRSLASVGMTEFF